jgi:DNA-binding transcriptional ArsR family regulator
MLHIRKSNAAAHDRTIRRFALKIAALLAFKYTLALSTLWIFVWGTLTLVMRTAFSTPREVLWWGLAGLLPGVVSGLILARRRSPGHSTIRALLDQHSGQGGLLMAEEIGDLGEWQLPPAIVTPRVRWQGGGAWALFLSAAAFLAITLLIPMRFAAITADRPLDVAQQTEELAEQIEALKQQEIIEPDKAESLEAKLDEIRADASGEDPAKTWEALDHLQDAIAKTAGEATEEMVANSAELGHADALSKALMEGAGALNSKLLTESMKELSDLTKAAAEDDRLFDGDLSQDTLDALKAGKLSKEQLKQLSAALGKAKGRLAQRLAVLREAGLIDLETLKACENAGQCDSAGLAAFLAENGADMSVADMLAAWDRPSRGGVDRGRGDAPMTSSDGTSEQGAKFKEQVLSPSALAGFKDSQLVGRSVGAPSVENVEAPKSGALSGAGPGGGSAFTQTVLPRHKPAVKRYFERPER